MSAGWNAFWLVAARKMRMKDRLCSSWRKSIISSRSLNQDRDAQDFLRKLEEVLLNPGGVLIGKTLQMRLNWMGVKLSAESTENVPEINLFELEIPGRAKRVAVLANVSHQQSPNPPKAGKLGQGMSSLCPCSFSTIQVFNPSHRLNVRDLPKVTLGGGKVSMPHDHLADDPYRRA